MSNKPRKKKKKSTKKCRLAQTSSAFDNYEQYETTMDNVIQLLNTQYDIASHQSNRVYRKNARLRYQQSGQ
ncbi:hypothetical protein [Photobacterium damselae]|uniref:hypothetical protein n=1 Tax=Photobacterium damselae TaxID=38293 RepID=UPI004069428F